MSKTYNELEKEYRKLAKRADQRLVRIEQLSKSDKKFRGAKQFAYERARRDIKAWGGSTKKPRFNTKPPKTTQGLKAKIADIKNFLESKTSTKSGIKATYKKGAETMRQKYGFSASWEDMVKYYQKGINNKLESKFGYNTTIIALGVIKKNKSKVKEELVKSGSNVLTSDKALNKVINEMLLKYSSDLKEIGVL